MTHTIPIRIYYEDTDSGGVVYHASYLRFAERGRTEFLRKLGYNNSDLAREEGIYFVVRHIGIDYLSPSFLDDVLSLKTSVTSLRNSSFVMQQNFTVDSRANAPICAMKVSLVCVDSKTLRPKRLPEDIRALFEDHKVEHKED
ncbi:MAG: tol-pal system-associated acyl-CoA thioesterase [Alphaproteobacteria bacterium]|nr:tol-pal system-associated acyl-CoA thioesterase [Alphaproteobacteria bacterium]